MTVMKSPSTVSTVGAARTMGVVDNDAPQPPACGSQRGNPVADFLRGLAVQLSDRCRCCGSYDAVIGEGKGPHRAAFFCSRCERHRGWMANEAHAFVSEVVNKFGKPPTLIKIRR
jgi:hypothetical protein